MKGKGNFNPLGGVLSVRVLERKATPCLRNRKKPAQPGHKKRRHHGRKKGEHRLEKKVRPISIRKARGISISRARCPYEKKSTLLSRKTPTGRGIFQEYNLFKKK